MMSIEVKPILFKPVYVCSRANLISTPCNIIATTYVHFRLDAMNKIIITN